MELIQVKSAHSLVTHSDGQPSGRGTFVHIKLSSNCFGIPDLAKKQPDSGAGM